MRGEARHLNERFDLDAALREISEDGFVQLGHIGGENFALGGHDLLAHDDPFRVQPLSRNRPHDGVMVRDHHPIDAFRPAEPLLREGEIHAHGVGLHLVRQLAQRVVELLAVQDDLGAIAPRRLLLHERGGLGHHDRGVLADVRHDFVRTINRPLGEVQTFAKADAKMKYAGYKVQTDDFASVLLRFANGTRGNLAVSQVAAGRKNCIRVEIYGSKKSAWWCSEEPSADALNLPVEDGDAFDPAGLLNPGKAIPTLARCAEFGAMLANDVKRATVFPP